MEDFLSNAKKYYPYLEELQGRIYKSSILFVLVFFLGFGFSSKLVRLFVSFFDMKGVVIAATSPFQFAGLAVDVGIFCALIATLPLVIYHIFSFSSNALTDREKKWFFLSIPASILLFLMGFMYGFGILYYSFEIFASINESLGIQNIWDVSTFLSQVILTASLLGLVFQYPIILTALIRLKLLSVNFLRSKRRVAIFSAFVVTALLPPTDGLSLLAMVVPLILMYEATILINFNS